MADDPGTKFRSSSLPRIVTWGRFIIRELSRRSFYFFNAHFDHRGREARLESAVASFRLPKILLKCNLYFVETSSVAIITDDYLEEIWPHDKSMIDLKKHLPIMQSGALLHQKSREIEKDVTYIEEDQCADDFRFNLMRSLSVTQSLPSTSSYVHIN